MNCYRTVLLDDEPLDLEVLRRALLECKFAEQLQLETVASAEELASLVEQGTDIDILFADIDLDGEHDGGIQAVANLFPAGSGTQVIYATGYIDQAENVYETEHAYLLVKPINTDKLESALSKAINALEADRRSELQVIVDRRSISIDPSKVLFVESDKRRAILNLSQGDAPLVVYEKLADLEARMPASVIRCHGSFLVNLAHVVGVSATTCTLDNGVVVPVSRARSAEVKRAFSRNLRAQL